MAHPPSGSAQKERIRFALCCAAVILRRFLCQRAFRAAAVRNRKGGRTFRSRIYLISPKREDSPHQSCLQPFTNILVHSKIHIAALVVELAHGKTGYVAAEMLQDNLHCVRVALCRRQNDRVRNKSDFRVLVTIRPIHQHFPPNIFLAAQRSLSVCTVRYFWTCGAAFQSLRPSFP